MARTQTTPGIWSDETGTHYPDIDALVAAECNGWSVLAIAVTPPDGLMAGLVVYGPYPSQREAQRAQVRIRARWRRRESNGSLPFPVGTKVSVRVRPIQRENKERSDG